MPKTIRELIKDLKKAGFAEVPGGGKGSHRKFFHPRLPDRITLSGPSGGDAQPYQENLVRKAIQEVS